MHLNNLRIFSFVLALVIALTSITMASAQRRGISVVRDAEIEALVKDYARPLMKAAGLRQGSVAFHIVNSNEFNAFVTGRDMFIHTGLLLQSKTPNEVIGVIAHELGHIKGGHIVRLAERAEAASKIARISTLLGIGLGAAGAAAGNGDAASAGIGVATGGHSIALRSIRAYQREEEEAADRAAATYLRKSGQSGAGMLRTFKKLSDNIAIQAGRIDPYLLSHPMPRERITSLSALLRGSRHFNKKDSPALQKRHDMARAKIAAYVGGSRYAQSLLAGKELVPDARLYGRAIVAYLYGSPKKALPLIEKLSKKNPKNAYLHEMRGEILLRTGKGAKAAQAFRKAITLDRYKAGFIRVELGHALLESGSKTATKQAIIELKKGLARDPTAVGGFQYLARAYGETGDIPNALLASAEFAMRTGRRNQAKAYAKRAKQGFKRGSPGWLRADDITQIK